MSLYASDPAESKLQYPYAVCGHPTDPDCYFFAVYHGVKMSRSRNISWLVGDSQSGDEEGIGCDAKLSAPSGMRCTADGSTLYVCDSYNNRVRKINLRMDKMTTLAGSGRTGTEDGTQYDACFTNPMWMCFQRSSQNPESLLYVPGACSIRQIETATGKVTTLKLASDSINPTGIETTTTGMIITSCRATVALYAINPLTGEIKRLAGAVDKSEAIKDFPPATDLPPPPPPPPAATGGNNNKKNNVDGIQRTSGFRLNTWVAQYRNQLDLTKPLPLDRDFPMRHPAPVWYDASAIHLGDPFDVALSDRDRCVYVTDSLMGGGVYCVSLDWNLFSNSAAAGK